MEVKEAARLAKQYVSDLFAEEGITGIALEEVDFDHDANAWKVTIGFMQPAHARNRLDATTASPWLRALERSYKVVRINDDNGGIESVMDRFLAPAE
jgi:hypothetical protein